MKVEPDDSRSTCGLAPLSNERQCFYQGVRQPEFREQPGALDDLLLCGDQLCGKLLGRGCELEPLALLNYQREWAKCAGVANLRVPLAAFKDRASAHFGLRRGTQRRRGPQRRRFAR